MVHAGDVSRSRPELRRQARTMDGRGGLDGGLVARECSRGSLTRERRLRITLEGLELLRFRSGNHWQWVVHVEWVPFH